VLQAGSDAEFSEPQLHPKSWEIIGLNTDDFEFMKEKMIRQYQGIVNLFLTVPNLSPLLRFYENTDSSLTLRMTES